MGRKERERDKGGQDRVHGVSRSGRNETGQGEEKKGKGRKEARTMFSGISVRGVNKN